MAEISPLLVFDSSAILAGRLARWQEWARFGVCVLPQAVLAELERLAREAIEPQEESTARAFLRHQPSLGFAVSAARAWVEEVNASGHSLKARLEQAIAECAYALAQQQPGFLVVVSNDRPLVGRIQELGVSNLCAISLAELNRWVRQQQRPQAVARALGRLPRPPLPATPLSSRPSARPPSPVSQGSRGSPLGLTPAGVQKALALVWALAFFSAAGLLAWRWLDPKGSEGIWRQLPLSRIPWLRDRSSPNRGY
ncbi:PIN domain-containing protein [Synechococcus sp. O70.1]|uniref:PIN domain-containing protein n=1 Tax=Synechococcus sp. O70.1 TaxID=2964535 RepID=UPI0039C4880A